MAPSPVRYRCLQPVARLLFPALVLALLASWTIDDSAKKPPVVLMVPFVLGCGFLVINALFFETVSVTVTNHVVTIRGLLRVARFDLDEIVAIDFRKSGRGYKGLIRRSNGMEHRITIRNRAHFIPFADEVGRLAPGITLFP